jgi:hypothetical protein
VDVPVPKFATARNPDLPTIGTLQGRFAGFWLGQPLMPWQQNLADVAGEYDPDTGQLVHSVVLCTVPRQAGKSHLALARKAERCTSMRGYRSWYTAQTGGDARDQFLKFGDAVAAARLGLVPGMRTLVGNGREVMRFPNTSTIRPHPPTEKALHGKQSDDNDIDEAWAFSEAEGQSLLQAIGPTQLTRIDFQRQAGAKVLGTQTWIWSAGGTVDSTWLASLVARGRAGDPSICYLEYGIPDDADPEDIGVIAAHHPAYGHTLGMRSLETLRSTFGTDVSGWARAVGNRWTEVIGGGIDADTWRSIVQPDPIPAGCTTGYGVARSEDGHQVVIAAASQVDEQLVVVEVLEARSSWNAAHHINAWAKNAALAVYPNGPSASVQRDLIDLGRKDLVKMSQWDAVAATSTILDSLDQRAIRFRPNPDLDDAVASASLRKTANGGKVWASAGERPIAALEAATAALAALRPSNQPERDLPVEGPLTVFA